MENSTKIKFISIRTSIRSIADDFMLIGQIFHPKIPILCKNIWSKGFGIFFPKFPMLLISRS